MSTDRASVTPITDMRKHYIYTRRAAGQDGLPRAAPPPLYSQVMITNKNEGVTKPHGARWGRFRSSYIVLLKRGCVQYPCGDEGDDPNAESWPRGEVDAGCATPLNREAYEGALQDCALPFFTCTFLHQRCGKAGQVRATRMGELSDALPRRA